MHPITSDLVESLISEQRTYVNHFFDQVNLEEIEKAVHTCLECKGMLILTGVGKSGIIAEKIAMTLVSTGTRALFLPIANFLHGDIGVVGKEDVVLMLSKSGESNELLSLLPYIKRKGAKVLAIVSDDESRLARSSDQTVYLPVVKELCPFDLAPTTSTAVQLLFGDLLSMALMKEKGFSIEEFATNHPRGAIGKKITLRVKDLMRKGDELPLCRSSDLLVDQIVQLSDKKCGCLLVEGEEGELLGIFTDGDLRRALQTDGASAMKLSMEVLMTRNPISIGGEELAQTALKKMQQKQLVTVVPVVEEGKLIGLIRLHDIIHEGI